MSERSVFGDEEIRSEPLTDDDAAEDREEGDCESGEDRDQRSPGDGLTPCGAAPPTRPARDRQRQCRNRPGFVARETRERENEAHHEATFSYGAGAPPPAR